MQPVRIRQADVVGLVGPLVLLVLGVGLATRRVAWLASLSVWAACLLLGILAIALRARRPSRGTEILAAFWPLPVVFGIYMTLNPLIDRVSPTLMDPFILHADHLLFGGYPAVAVAGALPPPVVDLLMIAYVSYYAWPVAMAVVLYRRDDREGLARFTTLMLLAFWLNFACYVMVPVIGPRFTLASHFAGPPQGWLVGTFLFEALLRSPMIRDCFPSGHTALSLLVLWFAFRHHRRFFWVMLPFGVGIISATLLMRFHYVLDLVFAVPLLLAAHFLAESLYRRFPEAWTWDAVEHLKPAHV